MCRTGKTTCAPNHVPFLMFDSPVMELAPHSSSLSVEGRVGIAESEIEHGK